MRTATHHPSTCVIVCTLVILLLGPAETTARPYQDAPMFRAAVERGELPPVEQRLPEEPLIVEPFEAIGEYGGTWLRMMKGTSDFHAFGRCVYEQMLRWAPDPKDGIVPGLVKTWAFSDGGKTLTLTLRKGLK